MGSPICAGPVWHPYVETFLFFHSHRMRILGTCLITLSSLFQTNISIIFPEWNLRKWQKSFFMKEWNSSLSIIFLSLLLSFPFLFFVKMTARNAHEKERTQKSGRQFLDCLTDQEKGMIAEFFGSSDRSNNEHGKERTPNSSSLFCPSDRSPR